MCKYFSQLDNMEAELNAAFAELDTVKESFWNSHNERMAELSSAMESLTKTLQKFDEIDEEQQRISDELDALLASLEC